MLSGGLEGWSGCFFKDLVIFREIPDDDDDDDDDGDGDGDGAPQGLPSSS